MGEEFVKKIEKYVNEYLEDRKPGERYSSFDYCYNYFYKFFKNNKQNKLCDEENIELSCLNLGFYLASWGMFRGSSSLIEKSLAYYKDVIEEISKTSKNIWDIDINSYTDDNIEKLIQCKERINKSYGDVKDTDNRTSKIMLGVFGVVPAYDTYFKKWLAKSEEKGKFCQTFNKPA